MLFAKAHPLCHDVNLLTRSANHIDVVIGFSSGDIIWFDPMSNKYTRLNKNVRVPTRLTFAPLTAVQGTINSHPVADIKWLPGSENLFLAAHSDGALVLYDKERDDAPFVPEEPSAPAATTPAATPRDSNVPAAAATAAATPAAAPPRDCSGPAAVACLTVGKSVHSKNQKANPVACWSISPQPVNAFAFSPDCQHLAVVSEDGSLAIMDFHRERYGRACEPAVCGS